jgi:DNA-binding MarR family transcriptional regulator
MAVRFIDGYLAYLLARASHQVSREFHAQLRPQGLSVAQWRVLAALSDSGGVSLTELAEIVLFKQPTLTKVIDRMERDGWVKRLIDRADRRRLRIVITARGAAVVSGLLSKAKSHEAAVLASYSSAEIDNLKRILRQLLARSMKAARASLGTEKTISAAAAREQNSRRS